MSYLHLNLSASLQLAVQETSATCNIRCRTTFQFFKNGKKVIKMQGADAAKLQELVDANK